LTDQKPAIAYTLRRSSRARRLRLTVYCTGSVVLTAPSSLGLRHMEDFILQKTAWIIAKLDFFKKHPQPLPVKASKKEFAALKPQAFSLAKRKVDHWNRFYGFEYNRINIKNQTTRWGSCSKKGNLNFNYKIVKLGERLVDYLVVHELCHLKEFNHSEKFWALVAKTIPEYKACRKELKNHGRI